MTIDQLNQLAPDEAQAALSKCCGARNWVARMLAARPFADREALMQAADESWAQCTEADGLEAFTHHPKIGDLDSLAKKYSQSKAWAGGEQKGVEGASRETLEKLAELNTIYEKKFGFIFIVCATGKTAKEMLTLLEARMDHAYVDELKIAMAEQHKITRIRLNKLLS